MGVYIDGEQKVDLWGGVADTATGEPWQEDTVGVVYSVTKERRRRSRGSPVTAYWPEFAGGGKADMPVRYLFTHLAGLRVCLTQC